MYKITTEEELADLALERHPVELNNSGFDKNHYPRQVFINGYLLGIKCIVDQLKLTE